MYLTMDESLVAYIKEDDNWSDGQELKRLAGLYWKARWAHDNAEARRVFSLMGECLPERVIVSQQEDKITYRISAALTDGCLCRFGPDWRQIQAQEPYVSTWTNGRETITYCEGDVTLTTWRQAHEM